jgi:hypothetical protein
MCTNKKEKAKQQKNSELEEWALRISGKNKARVGQWRNENFEKTFKFYLIFVLFYKHVTKLLY